MNRSWGKYLLFAIVLSIVIQIPFFYWMSTCPIHSRCGAAWALFYILPYMLFTSLDTRDVLHLSNRAFALASFVIQTFLLTLIISAIHYGVRVLRQKRSTELPTVSK